MRFEELPFVIIFLIRTPDQLQSWQDVMLSKFHMEFYGITTTPVQGPQTFTSHLERRKAAFKA